MSFGNSNRIYSILSSLGNSNLATIELDTITTADFLDVITHTKPSAKNLSQKYTAWQREFESVWQKKTQTKPKIKNLQAICHPKWPLKDQMVRGKKLLLFQGTKCSSLLQNIFTLIFTEGNLYFQNERVGKGVVVILCSKKFFLELMWWNLLRNKASSLNFMYKELKDWLILSLLFMTDFE